MKHSIIRLLAVLLVLVLITGTAAAVTVDNSPTVVSFRIEGMNENLYYNSAISLSLTGVITVRDVINSYNSNPDVPQITVINEKENSHITQIGAFKEKGIGSPYDDGWMISVNGKDAGKAPDVTGIRAGDEIVVYYGDTAHMQYPEIDLTRMIADGIVKITNSDSTVDDKGNIDITKNPVAGATVTWDGMKYITDTNGEIIIDSTGAGVRHTIQIERYNTDGMPTVLRLAPGYAVKYGFDDVAEDQWYFDSVIFVSDRYLLNGVSETAFAPDEPMNRAMFVTVLGRLTGATVDQTETTGFPDVKSDGWSTGYISWAVRNGLVSGYPDGTFGQYNNITREQIVVLLYRYALSKEYDTDLAYSDLTAYTDFSKVAGYAETAMRWSIEKGLIQGDLGSSGSGGRLDPQGLASRAQAATLLERFISLFGS